MAKVTVYSKAGTDAAIAAAPRPGVIVLADGQEPPPGTPSGTLIIRK